MRHHFLQPLWKNNQVLQATLGICSALAITTTVEVALTMGIAVCIVTAFSSFFVALIRHWTPDDTRMITQLAIIATLVISVDEWLKAYYFEISKDLSVFVGLIITNCLVMGRAEAMARHNRPFAAWLDGLGAGLGYAVVITIVAALREVVGSNRFLGVPLLPHSFFTAGYETFSFMLLPPAAFFILGLMILAYQRLKGTAS